MDSFVDALRRVIFDVDACFEGPDTTGTDEPELEDEGVDIGETMLRDWDKERAGGGDWARRALENNLVGLKMFSNLDIDGSEEFCLVRGNRGVGLDDREWIRAVLPWWISSVLLSTDFLPKMLWSRFFAVVGLFGPERSAGFGVEDGNWRLVLGVGGVMVVLVAVEIGRDWTIVEGLEEVAVVEDIGLFWDDRAEDQLEFREWTEWSLSRASEAVVRLEERDLERVRKL
jgi:hypothetical protein